MRPFFANSFMSFTGFSYRYYIVGILLLVSIAGTISYINYRNQPIIEPYANEDRAALIALYYQEQKRLNPQNYGDTFETILDRKAFSAEDPKGSLYIALAKTPEKKLIGFVAYARYSINFGMIYYLAVDSSYRNKGYGTALLQYACEDLRESEPCDTALISVGFDNPSARKLYEKAGFSFLEKHSNGDLLSKPLHRKWYAGFKHSLLHFYNKLNEPDEND